MSDGAAGTGLRHHDAVSLVEAAQRAGRESVVARTRQEQRELGQFMTPPTIARFMASRLVAGTSGGELRVLEPAAGVGILAAAVVEALLKRRQPLHRIELLLYEIDERLAEPLRAACDDMQRACGAAGVHLAWTLTIGDFLLSDLALDGRPVDALNVIANPPFFKLGASDPRALAHPYAVWGQPNIYALFMAACARITPPGGHFCFITPRSWMSGAYFRAARLSLLRDVAIEALHAFDSRTDSFEEDAVLQETMITWAVGRGMTEAGPSVVLTRSRGANDLDCAAVHAVPAERLFSGDGAAMLTLPAAGADPLAGWTSTLGSHGLKVSTGPVVAFRAVADIRLCDEPGFTVPLLWMQHVAQQRIVWPDRKKREHIRATAENAWMLLPNAPMVLMRRFSPKEAPRRVVCAAYDGTLPGEVIGVENHLNYLYRPAGRMDVMEAKGLAAYLSSRWVDAHLRALAGTTQVNAEELRRLPLPPLERLKAIGASIGPVPSLQDVDRVVGAALKLDAVTEAAA